MSTRLLGLVRLSQWAICRSPCPGRPFGAAFPLGLIGEGFERAQARASIGGSAGPRAGEEEKEALEPPQRKRNRF